METESLLGGLHLQSPSSFSCTEQESLRSIATTFPHTSHLFNWLATQRSLTWIRPFGSMLDPSTSSATSKHATSMDMALVKAVLPKKRKWMTSPELEATGESQTLATWGMKSNATSRYCCVNIDTSVSSAEEHISKGHAHEWSQEVLKLHGDHPWYACELLWGWGKEEIGPTVLYSLTADPLPRLPLSIFQNKAAMKTLLGNPKLFKITCLINVDVFEELLLNHPNLLFCRSVFNGLCYGFWP